MERHSLIHNESEYQAALKRVRSLGDPDEGTPEFDEAELLTLLIVKYEEENHPAEILDPIEHIKTRMEILGLNQADMVPYFGDKSTVSKVLNGSRPLSLQHIRALNKGLRIPAEILIAEPEHV